MCCSYSPRDVTIARGESVTWTAMPGNSFDNFPGPAFHPMRFAGDAQPAQKSGTTTTRRFDQAAKFTFYCTNHGTVDGAGMAGTVTVTDPTAPPPPPAADTTPPRASLVLPARADRARAVLRRRGLRARLRTSEPGSATVILRRGSRTLGTRTVTLASAGEHSLIIRPTPTGRAALRRGRFARLTLRAVVRDTARNATTVTRSFAAR